MNGRKGLTVCVLLSVVLSLSAQTNVGELVPNSEDLEKVLDLRQQYEKQNNSYFSPSYIRQYGLSRRETLPMSQEAIYWLTWKQDPSKVFKKDISYRDTIIVNPLFMPVFFHGNYLPADLKLYDPAKFNKPTAYDKLSQPVTLFSDYRREMNVENSAYRYIERNHPDYFKYTKEDLPKDVLKTKVIKKVITDSPALESSLIV